MKDNTCLNVLLKCENCDHQEYVKKSEFDSHIKWMEDKKDPKILCPFCLGYMRPVNKEDIK